MTQETVNNDNGFNHKVDERLQRKIISRQRGKKSPWMGLGVFGMVGWSIMVPTLAGTFLGYWLDKKYPQTFSWTITMLFTGVILGCVVAWNWVKKEGKDINKN